MTGLVVKHSYWLDLPGEILVSVHCLQWFCVNIVYVLLFCRWSILEIIYMGEILLILLVCVVLQCVNYNTYNKLVCVIWNFYGVNENGYYCCLEILSVFIIGTTCVLLFCKWPILNILGGILIISAWVHGLFLILYVSCSLGGLVLLWDDICWSVFFCINQNGDLDLLFYWSFRWNDICWY